MEEMDKKDRLILNLSTLQQCLLLDVFQLYLSSSKVSLGMTKDPCRKKMIKSDMAFIRRLYKKVLEL